MIHERIRTTIYYRVSRYRALGRATEECFCVRGRCCTPTQRPDETESPWHVCSGSYSALRGRSGASEASTTTCNYICTHARILSTRFIPAYMHTGESKLTLYSVAAGEHRFRAIPESGCSNYSKMSLKFAVQ